MPVSNSQGVLRKMADQEVQSLALPEIVDLDSLDNIRDQMLEAVEQGSVVVDAKAVERVATNALLMLLSAAESARRNAFSYEINNVSEPMASAIERLGLSPQFQELTKG